MINNLMKAVDSATLSSGPTRALNRARKLMLVACLLFSSDYIADTGPGVMADQPVHCK